MPSLYRAVSIACGDVDDDGLADLLFGMDQGPANVLLLNQGNLTFTDASGLLPAFPSPTGPFAYVELASRTRSVALCRMADAPSETTLFFGNGDSNNALPQPNIAMRFDGSMNALDASPTMGLDFPMTLDQTSTLVCADLDDDGADDALFIGNGGGRDYLYLWGQ